jgi:hypothetical protein
LYRRAAQLVRQACRPSSPLIPAMGSIQAGKSALKRLFFQKTAGKTMADAIFS